MFSGVVGAAQQIQIDQPFARAAIMQQRNSAVFMNITNRGPDAQIVYAKSPSATTVELHTHINDNGIMRMRRIRQIDLPSGQQIMLKPGGLHVMLLGLKQNLIAGEAIEVTVGFADGSERLLQVPVKKVQMTGRGKNLHGGKPMMMTH